MQHWVGPVTVVYDVHCKIPKPIQDLWQILLVRPPTSQEGFAINPELVLEFYNARRRQLLQVQPNAAHFALAQLENDFKVTIITQNVDDLHERAGSKNVIHLHGELLKVRSTYDEFDVKDWTTDLVLGDTCNKGYQLRPHIVWFGEAVPMIEKAMRICETANILVIIGTSLQVYPAASLIHYVNPNIPIYYIDPRPSIQSNHQITVIPENATLGVSKVIQCLLID